MPTDHTQTRSIAENDLAKLLGIDRNVLREQRITHLQNETHWFQKKNEVRLNEAGVRELCTRLDLAAPEAWQAPAVNPWTTASSGRPALGESDLQFAAEKKDGGPAPEEPEKTLPIKPAPPPRLRKKDDAAALPDGVLAVFVIRRAKLNRHMIFAREKKGGEMAGEEIPVRVRDAQAVAIGQELHVKLEGSLGSPFGQQPRSQRQRLAPRRNPAQS